MRQEITNQLIEILAAIVILVIVLSLLIIPAVAIRNAAIRSKNSETPKTQMKAFELYTGQHDGHLWVLNRTSSYFLHHPDCPCNGKVEKDYE